MILMQKQRVDALCCAVLLCSVLDHPEANALRMWQRP